MGQLGNGVSGPNVVSSVPVLVSGPPAGGTYTFTSITAGEQHTCALRNDKAAMCWGKDDVGQLGNDPTLANSAVPQLVAGNHLYASLDAGRAHTCGVDTGGAAWCWGWDGNGQLGDGGGFTNSTTPRRCSWPAG